MSIQIAVRLTERLRAELDELVDGGLFLTRAQAVRAAIERLIEQEQRRAVGLAIAEGYRRMPQTDEEVQAATATAVRSIHEEPW